METKKTKPLVTKERAQEILATKGKGLFGSFGTEVTDSEHQEVDKVRDELLVGASRFIFWDDALKYIATGVLPEKI